MKIDLNYLNRFNKIEINEDINLDENLYKDSDVRRFKTLHVNGIVEIDYEDNLELNLTVKGIMVLPCAITLNDVDYNFESNIEQSIGNFEEIIKNNKNTLEISPILWENIVLEIPIRVVSENIKPSNTSGDGWEFKSV